METQLFDRLDRSEHLIVLASPGAAQSRGMEMEARHWFGLNRGGQVLIIVTAGDCNSWEDIRHHLIPPAVASNLTGEPLWIPLQHRRTDILANPNSHVVRGQLIEDLKQVVLCLYPGHDWGQLRGEERSQRRRALGLMSALTFLFLVLAVTAVGFAWYAQLQRSLAESRQLAAQSALVQSQSPSLLPRSILLAVESLRKNPNLEANQVLRSGVPLLGKPAFSIPYQGSLERMALSTGGDYLATAGYLEKQVHLWKVSDRKQAASLPHDAPIHDIAFSPDGRFLVVAGLSSTVLIVWNVATAKELGRFDCQSEVHGLTFSHDGRYLATGQKDHTVRIWRISIEEKVDARQTAILDHKDEVFGVTFSVDDRYLAASSLNVVALWELSDQGGEINAKHLGYVEAAAGVNSVAISPDDKYLATGICCNKPLQLWNLTNLDLAATMPDEGPESVMFSPDSKYVAAAGKDSTAVIWEVETQREVNRIQSRSGSIAFSSNGRHLVTQTEDAVVFWSWNNNDPITATFNPGSFSKFSSSVDGRTLVMADPDTAVASFDIYSHNSVLQITLDAGESTLALSNDGTYLATKREDDSVLVRILTGQPRVIAMMKDDKEEQNKTKRDVRSALFSSDGRHLVILKNSGTLLFWNLTNGEVGRSAFPDPEIYSIRLSEDGSQLVSASGRIRGRQGAQENHTIRIWERATGRSTGMIEIARPAEAKQFQVAIAISADGRNFATGAASVAQIWDSSTGRELTHLDHDKRIHDLAFSQDGKYLGTASVDGTARLWNTRTGQELTRMPHQGEVWKIAFNPDGKHLGTASDDRTARIWEYPAGREIARTVHTDMARGISFSLDGKRVMSWSPTAGEIKSWLWRPEDLSIEACQRLTHNLTSAEWREYFSEARRRTCPNLP